MQCLQSFRKNMALVAIMHFLQPFRKSISAQNSVRVEFVFGPPCVSAMVTISHQVKIAYGEGGKEWLVPSQFIKDAENCDWHHWFQVRASHPGLAALLFPSFLASNGFGVAIYMPLIYEPPCTCA